VGIARRYLVPIAWAVPAAAAYLLAAGCSRQAPVAPPAVPVQVKAVTVEPSATEMYADKVGEIKGSQEVDLRARVSGILVAKHFRDGTLVKQGELLFSIDAREFRAQVASSRARLASAEANLARARQDVERYRPLLEEDAIARQVYDNAVTAERQAEAEVSASRAALEETQLGLEYASVRAPLSGRIGAAQVFPGSLITAGQTVLATISSDDPAWAYFTISESELLEFQRQAGKGGDLPPDDPRRTVQLIMSDGRVYPHPGHINFGDRALNPTTGTYTLRAEVPNPDHALIPGLFVRVRAMAGELQNALVVPDRAVQEQLGKYFLTVVGIDDKAELRPVELGPRFGNRQVIESGITAGDRVVVEGLQKARPGTTLQVTEVQLQDFDRPAEASVEPATSGAG
jgi:membrane fusion protein (multidrug efflux system)